jgi:superfamily II DNA helicase RecQ
MKYPIQTRHDLVPPNPVMDDLEWVEQNILQFLVYCNSRSDAEKTALYLRNRLPMHDRHHIVWYHSGMSDQFRTRVIEAYEVGEILGLCCMDACGMVSNSTHYNISIDLQTFLRALI